MGAKKFYDFRGWASRYGVKCTDGRTILPGAFAHMDGKVVPLVWQHGHDDINNVLGHGVLEERKEGLYIYGSLNTTPAGQQALAALQHGDLTSLSIYANQLKENNQVVSHGTVREASLVLAGANSGAVIEYVAFQHADGSVRSSVDEAIIYSGEIFEKGETEMMHSDEEEEGNGETIEDVFNTLNDKQKEMVYVMLGTLMADDGTDKQLEQGEVGMKHNVFDGEEPKDGGVVELDFAAVKADALTMGSLKSAVLQHAGTYGIGSDRANLELLFPDARPTTDEPTWISRRMEWVSAVLNGTRHSPFGRIKSIHADITADAARAKGYITGTQKVSEVFPVLRRLTTPTTVYKAQKLDRDDVVDITDFDVIRWMKQEMRVMYDEEIARAILIGDGRAIEATDKINEEHVRPIYGDDSLYVHYSELTAVATSDDLIDAIIGSRTYYRGSGSTTCFVAPSQLTAWLLLRDETGHRYYRTAADVAAELGVTKIVEVPLMEGVSRTKGSAPSEYTANLRAIVVNLQDYTVGADKGGALGFFDDFDIDFNQLKFLMESRFCGALSVPKSAIVLEQKEA